MVYMALDSLTLHAYCLVYVPVLVFLVFEIKIGEGLGFNINTAKRHQDNLQISRESCTSIEVECKFSVPSDYHQRLQQIRAIRTTTLHHHDVYLDLKGLHLIRKDHWLRFR